MLVFETDAANRRAIEGVAPANFLDWHPHVRSLEAVSAVEPFGFTYTEGAEPQSMPGARVSRGFFEAFGVAAMYGRTFTPEEFSAGRNNVVVLSYGTWAQRFGADPALVGRVVRINGQPTTIVGVMPPSFAPRLMTTFNERGVWAPKVWAEYEHRLRGSRHFNAVARLKPGFTQRHDFRGPHLRQSGGGAAGLEVADPYGGARSGGLLHRGPAGSGRGHAPRSPLHAHAHARVCIRRRGPGGLGRLRLMSLVSAQRTREFGVRLALGAARGEILRMVMRQGVALTTTGLAIGLAGALAGGRILQRFLFGIGPNDLLTLSAVSAALGVVAAIACLLPALRATRVSPIVALRAE